jgi:hypothetical protein
MVMNMVKKGFFPLILILILFSFALAGEASAQSYYFAVPTEVVNVTITDQGTMAIDYAITFDNTHGGSAIDAIDIGLPNNHYILSSITADINGHPISNITKGDPQYIAIGVSIYPGAYSIQPGQTGTLNLHVREVDQVLYPYTYNNVKDYVSFEFIPNTFGSEYVTGSTNFTLSLHLPTGIQSNEPIYYTPQQWTGDPTPQSSYDSQGRVTYTWQDSQADATTGYVFGAAFPSKYVPASAIVHPSIFDQIGSFFASLGISGDSIFPCCFICGFILLFVGIPALGVISSNKRKLQYLPPKISIEGHGIKRGLTAVEAAILMEQPMDKVMTMIMFSVIKKGAATVVTKDPLKLEVTKPSPEGLRPYETDFLAAFEAPEKERRNKLTSTAVALVRSVSDSMKGFSRKESIAYYQEIINKAWAEVEAAGTPEVKGQKFDDNMDWTMLDKDFDNRTRNVFGTGPIFVPIWWGRYDPVFRGSTGGAVTPTVSTGGARPSVSMPNLPGSTFAASIINGSQSFAAGILGGGKSFTSGVANVTNPVPVSTSSGGRGFSGGGGGHSCACACACAGCACACAGGGR